MSREPTASANASKTKFLTPMETASLVDPTRLSPMASASVPLDTPSTAAVFALCHAPVDTSPSKVDVPSARSTPSSELRSTAATALLDSTRTTLEFARDWS